MRRLFSGAAAANNRVYFAPHNSDSVGIFDVAKREFSTLLTLNGSPGKYAVARAIQ